jgi:hypothetical protein
MLNADQHAALLMIIADLRIQLANATAERDLLKKTIADQHAQASEERPGGDSPNAS